MLDLLAKKRVFVGTIYLTIVFFFHYPNAAAWWLGFAVAFAGEGIRTWSSGYLFKNEQLATTGPYSVVRNPLYLGSFLLGFGLTLMGGNIVLVGLYPLVFFPIYLRKIEQEEGFLLEQFGEEVMAFFQRVPRLVPRLSTYEPADHHWNLQRVIFVHREWGNWVLLAGFAGWFYYLLQAAGG